MIITGSNLIDTPIMGLQTGDELARTKVPIIDPGQLKILAYEVTGPHLAEHPSLLVIDDVRELSDLGFIIDSSDELVSPKDIVKLQKIYDLHFPLVGMQVHDEKRHKLGRVTDYTLDIGSFIIQQLSVKRPLLQSINETELLIHRTQIIEINDTAIVVKSEAKIPELARNEVAGSYINPFRKNEQTTEAIDTQLS